MAKKKALSLPPEIEEAAAIVNRLVESGKDIELPKPPKSDDPKVLIQHSIDVVVACQQNINENYAIQGFHLLHLKENTQHGELQLAYENAGISARTAQRRMKVAKLLLSLPEGKSDSVSHLTFRRQLKLAQLPPGRVDEMAESGELEKLAELPERQFNELVKLRKENANQQKKIELLRDEEYRRSQKERVKSKLLQDFPKSVVELCELSGTTGLLGQELSARLQILFDQMNTGMDLHADKKTQAIQFRRGVKACLTGLASAINDLREVYDYVADYAEDGLQVEEPPVLEDIEIQESFDQFRRLLANHGARPDAEVKRKR